MGKLILQTQISIDGFIADPNGGTNWMIWNWGPEWDWDETLRKRITEITQSASTILISRQMAEEGFIAYWKEICDVPDDARFELAKHITNTPKLVASTGLTKEVKIPGGWNNVDLISKTLSGEIQNFKDNQNNNMIVYGGSTLVSYLIGHNLIDEYYFVVNPVALGDGLSIFQEKTNLRLINASYFSCGVILSQYEKKTTDR